MPENPWRVQAGALFGRLDSFLSRVGDLNAAFQAAAQFQRLERVEIGSTKVGSTSRSFVPLPPRSATSLSLIGALNCHPITVIFGKSYDQKF